MIRFIPRRHRRKPVHRPLRWPSVRPARLMPHGPNLGTTSIVLPDECGCCPEPMCACIPDVDTLFVTLSGVGSCPCWGNDTYTLTREVVGCRWSFVRSTTDCSGTVGPNIIRVEGRTEIVDCVRLTVTVSDGSFTTLDQIIASPLSSPNTSNPIYLEFNSLTRTGTYITCSSTPTAVVFE